MSELQLQRLAFQTLQGIGGPSYRIVKRRSTSESHLLGVVQCRFLRHCHTRILLLHVSLVHWTSRALGLGLEGACSSTPLRQSRHFIIDRGTRRGFDPHHTLPLWSWGRAWTDSCSRAQRRRRVERPLVLVRKLWPMIPQSCTCNPGLRGFHRRNFSAYRKVTMGVGGFEGF